MDISEECFIKIACNCPQLEEIKVYSSKAFTDRVLIAFLDHCKNLKKISADFTEVGDPSLKKIASLKIPMQTLHLVECKNISSGAVEEVLKTSKDSLKVLVINCRNINHRILDLLCIYHPPLVYFDFDNMRYHLGDNVYIHPNAVELLSVIQSLSKPIPRIKEMVIWNFHDIDFSVLKKLVDFCPTIKRIHVSTGQMMDIASSFGQEVEEFREKFRVEFGVELLN